MSTPWTTHTGDLARRILGGAADRVTFEEDDGLPGRSYRYSCAGGALTVIATDAVSASVGLRAYLRNELGLDVQWATILPLAVDALPDCPPRSGSARVADQYMLNFCTYGYSTALWDWTEWERELDWMAVHGITMPLALVGHESVLFEAFRRLGLDDDAGLAFLGDPIYLPWQFMGCLEGDRPAVTTEWLAQRRDLGARILQRCRDLGMRAILPAFTGHVPAAWGEGARPRDWQGNTTWFLDPDDALFADAAEQVATVQREFFGAVSHFAADPFIEMVPVDDDPHFPARVGHRILEGLSRVVAHPVWVMQAWPFSYQRDYWSGERVQEFLSGIDDAEFLILDLWAEADPIWTDHDGFAGKDWHWCGLLNFGGRSDAVADLPKAHRELERALASAHPPVGIGLAMESIRHNAVFFELLCDSAWERVDDLGTWIGRFGQLRYGLQDDRVRHAWRLMLATVYDTRGRRIYPEDFHGILTRRPDLPALRDPQAFRELVRSMMWFEPLQLLEAWRLLETVLADHPELGAGPLGLDLVEVAQAAALRAVDELVARAAERDAGARDLLSGVLDALETLLGTRPETRLDAAETLAGDLRSSQRHILTAWNPAPGTELDDYSGRIWHGLVGRYYSARLAAWLDGPLDPELPERLDRVWASFMAETIAAPEPVEPAAASAALRGRVERVLA